MLQDRFCIPSAGSYCSKRLILSVTTTMPLYLHTQRHNWAVVLFIFWWLCGAIFNSTVPLYLRRGYVAASYQISSSSCLTNSWPLKVTYAVLFTTPRKQPNVWRQQQHLLLLPTRQLARDFSACWQATGCPRQTLNAVDIYCLMANCNVILSGLHRADISG